MCCRAFRHPCVLCVPVGRGVCAQNAASERTNNHTCVPGCMEGLSAPFPGQNAHPRCQNSIRHYDGEDFSPDCSTSGFDCHTWGLMLQYGGRSCVEEKNHSFDPHHDPRYTLGAMSST